MSKTRASGAKFEAAADTLRAAGASEENPMDRWAAAKFRGVGPRTLRALTALGLVQPPEGIEALPARMANILRFAQIKSLTELRKALEEGNFTCTNGIAERRSSPGARFISVRNCGRKTFAEICATVGFTPTTAQLQNDTNQSIFYPSRQPRARPIAGATISIRSKMTVSGVNITENQIASCIARMKGGDFTSAEIAEVAAKSGVGPSDALARSLIQVERRKGNIVARGKRYWRWIEKNGEIIFLRAGDKVFRAGDPRELVLTNSTTAVATG